MMLVTFMVLPFLAARPVLAQDTLKLDLGKALEIALSENPTVKVADKEIQKKKYARKGSYASLFPQISFAGDYNRTLKKQVMYMDFDMGDMGGGSLPEGTDMSSMDEGEPSEKELLRRPSGKRLLPGIQAKLRQCHGELSGYQTEV